MHSKNATKASRPDRRTTPRAEASRDTVWPAPTAQLKVHLHRRVPQHQATQLIHLVSISRREIGI
eukprot:7885015-Alexandrium_andersonii.AAC.1